MRLVGSFGAARVEAAAERAINFMRSRKLLFGDNSDSDAGVNTRRVAHESMRVHVVTTPTKPGLNASIALNLIRDIIDLTGERGGNSNPDPLIKRHRQ